MAAADYRLLTEATGVRIAEALEDVTAMVGPKGDPGDVSEAELTAKLADKADVIVDTASGAIASFPDGAAAAAKDITIAIEPVQAGSGDPSPTNVRPISGFDEVKVYDDQRYGGLVEWNQLAAFDSRNIPSASKGITYSSADGKSVTFNGTATGQELRTGWFNLAENTGLSGKNGHIVLLLSKALSGEFSDGTVSAGFIGSNLQNIGTPIRTTLPQRGQFRITTSVSEGCICNDYTVTFNCCDLTEMFGPGNEPTTQLFLDYFPNIQDEYFPYNAGETMTVGQVNGEAYRAYAIEMPTEAGTVYGGTLDVTTGVLTVTHGNIASYNGESLPGKWISSMDVYSAGGTPTTGAQVVYELATPQTYQLTPVEIEMLLGDNNVWADTGDSTVTYRADTKLYIQKINAPTDDDMIADAQIASGKYFIIGGNLYRSTTTIPAGDAINPGTNCILTNLADALNAINA